jgi:hypothetical protein
MAGCVPPATVRATLDPATLMAAAEAETGLREWGDRGFVEPFARWVTALADEGRLHGTGVELIRLNTLRILANRLRVERDLAAHPEVLDEDVDDPIVITGLPRTGTTKLHQMLARHHGVRGIRTWQLLNPAPLPDAPAGGRDPRIAVAEQAHAMSSQLFPEFQAGHPSLPEEVDEEMFMMEMTFEALTYWRADLPAFEAWWRTRDRRAPYAYLKRLLQYLQWQDGGRRDRRFVLKTPLHLGNLDVLHELFPGATVVHCHRDPRVSVASNARLHELIWRMGTDEVDLHRVGDVVVDYWSRALADGMDQREALGLPVLDVPYDLILSDARGVLRDVLRRHGMELTTADAEAMRDWEKENPQHRFGRHEYTQEAYGLSDARIERAFGRYLAVHFPGGAQ